MIKTQELKIDTKGNCHVIDITPQVEAALGRAKISNGTVTVFNVGSIAGITTVEFEPGLANPACWLIGPGSTAAIGEYYDRY